MLEPNRQHREYKLVQEAFNHRKTWTTEKTEYPTGDIIVSDGTDYYSVFGHPVNRGEGFNPRTGYLLNAKTRADDDGWSAKWDTRIMITGKAMALTGDTLFVAGAPLVFKPHDFGATYKGEYGSVLLATSAKDGATLAELKLDALPVWDGMASGYNKLFISMLDGSVICLGAE